MGDDFISGSYEWKSKDLISCHRALWCPIKTDGFHFNFRRFNNYKRFHHNFIIHRTPPNARILVLIQDTGNSSGFASLLSDSIASARTSVVSANITTSSAQSRPVIRTVPNGTPQPDFSDILIGTWSMQVLKVVGAKAHP